jgi:hypothetical protein
MTAETTENCVKAFTAPFATDDVETWRSWLRGPSHHEGIVTG